MAITYALIHAALDHLSLREHWTNTGAQSRIAQEACKRREALTSLRSGKSAPGYDIETWRLVEDEHGERVQRRPDVDVKSGPTWHRRDSSIRFSFDRESASRAHQMQRITRSLLALDFGLERHTKHYRVGADPLVRNSIESTPDILAADQEPALFDTPRNFTIVSWSDTNEIGFEVGVNASDCETILAKLDLWRAARNQQIPATVDLDEKRIPIEDFTAIAAALEPTEPLILNDAVGWYAVDVKCSRTTPLVLTQTAYAERGLRLEPRDFVILNYAANRTLFGFRPDAYDEAIEVCNASSDLLAVARDGVLRDADPAAVMQALLNKGASIDYILPNNGDEKAAMERIMEENERFEELVALRKLNPYPILDFK